MTEIVYKELSYEIVGALFEAYNRLGYGYPEKYYQRTIAECLREKNIIFQEQVACKIKVNGHEIGKFFIDFVIADKVVLEIKKSARFSKQNIEQVNSYLKVSGLQLAILANFAPDGVKIKRLLNLKSYNKK